MNLNHEVLDLSSVLALADIDVRAGIEIPEFTRQRLAECIEMHLVAFINSPPNPVQAHPLFYLGHECAADIRSIYSKIVKVLVRSEFGYVNDNVVGRTTRDLYPAFDFVIRKFAKRRSLLDSLVDDLTKIYTESEVSENPQSTRTAVWSYKPIESKIEPHAEFDSRIEDLSGFVAIGARARGKSHKHNGTNCDDYFHVGHCGKWNVVAVSDGAGSKKFSRIGAKLATEFAVDYLKDRLSSHDFSTAEFTSAAGGLANESLSSITNIVADTYLHVHELIVSTCIDRSRSELREEYIAEAGHELEVNDFACTLLLTIQTKIVVDDNHLDLIVAGQVGDGLICLKSKSGTVQVLGKPDSGGFSGETEFITSNRMANRESLLQRIYPWVGNLSMLAVMTDGVADDYFPPQDMAPALFCDLILNGALDLRTEISESSTPSNDCLDKYVADVESIAENPCNHKIASAQALSHHLSVSPLDLLKQVDELVKYTIVDLDSKPHERLCRWLDLYHVRGSADDRTLVLLANGSLG